MNLVAADMCILMDMDYNPQNNRQAEDRVHRIGQTKPVTIVYMLTPDTLETNILKINLKKMKLDAAFGGEQKTALAMQLAANQAQAIKSGNTSPSSRAGSSRAASSSSSSSGSDADPTPNLAMLHDDDHY